jgi:hypothetical protein
MNDITAAKAAHAEATGKSRTFTWDHKVEGPGGEVGVETMSLEIPRKFKRFKFSRRVAAGDYLGALEVVFGRDVLEPLEDWDMDAEEFEGFMTALGEAIGGTGNS